MPKASVRKPLAGKRTSPKRNKGRAGSRRKSKAQQRNDSAEAFTVYDILHQVTVNNTRYFLIAWSGLDPDTGELWDQNYEPESVIGDDLLQGWKIKRDTIRSAATKKAEEVAARTTIHWYLKHIAKVETEEHKRQVRAGIDTKSFTRFEAPGFYTRRGLPRVGSSTHSTDRVSPYVHNSSQSSPAASVGPHATGLLRQASSPSTSPSRHLPSPASPIGGGTGKSSSPAAATSSDISQSNTTAPETSLETSQTQASTPIADPSASYRPDQGSESSSQAPGSQASSTNPSSPQTLPDLPNDIAVVVNPPVGFNADEYQLVTASQLTRGKLSEISSSQSASGRQGPSPPPGHRVIPDSRSLDESLRTQQDFNSDHPHASDNLQVPATFEPESSGSSSRHIQNPIGSAVSGFESQIPFIPSQVAQISNPNIPITSSSSDVPQTYSTFPEPPSDPSAFLDRVFRTNSQPLSKRLATEQSQNMASGQDISPPINPIPTIEQQSLAMDQPAPDSNLAADMPNSLLQPRASSTRKRSLSASSAESDDSQSQKRARIISQEEAEAETGEATAASVHQQLREQALTNRIESLENQLEVERSVRTELEVSMNELQTRFEDQSKEYELVKAKLAKSEAAHDVTRQRLTKLHADLEALREECSSLRKQIEGLQQAIQDSKVPELEELAEALRNASRVPQLEKRLALAQSDLAYTQEKYQTASTAAQQLREESDAVREENQELKRKADGEATKLRAMFQDNANKALTNEIRLLKAQKAQLQTALETAGKEQKLLAERLEREERRAGMSLNTRSSSPGTMGARAAGQLTASSAVLGANASANSSRAASPAAGGPARGTFRTSPLHNSMTMEENP